MIARNGPYAWKLLGICLGLILLSVLTMPWWTVDDAFISYRYGKNWLETGRLTWNAGEPQLVEGYTGILLPMLAAALLKLGLPLVAAVKVLGLSASLGTIAYFLRGLRAASVPALPTWVACLLLAINPLLTMHALSGLETSFFTLFIIGAYVHASENVGPRSSRLRHGVALAITLLLCGLSRPEGIAWAMFLSAGLLWRYWRNQSKAEADQRWLAAVLALIVLIGYWAWRWSYYGHFFPNSYHAKAYEGFLNPESGIALGKFLLYYTCLPFAFGIGVCIHRERPVNRDHFRPKPMMISAILFIGVVCFTYLRSNLWMNYGSRFFFPLLPLILLLIGENVAWNKVAGSSVQRIWIIGLITAQVALLGFRHVQERVFLNYYDRIVKEELVPVGFYIHDNFPKGTRVASYMDAGAVGFYSGMEIMDFGRLSDTYLAREKPTEAQVVEYFFRCEPAVVVMTSWNSSDLSYTEEAMAITRDPRFGSYSYARSWGNSVDYSYWQRLYIKE